MHNPPQHPHGNPVPTMPPGGPGYPGGPAPVPASAPVQKKTSVVRDYRWSIGLAIAAVLLFGLSLLLNANPIKVSPNPTERFTGDDDMIELEIEEGDTKTWALFETSSDSGGGCIYYDPDGELKGPDTWYSNAEGYGDWDTLGPLDTSEPGIYWLTCTDDADEYVLAGAGPLHAVKAQKFVTAVIIVFIAPSLLLAAIVVAVVTTVRRRSAVRQP